MAEADARDGGCLCQSCGYRYRADLMVENSVWERVRARNGNLNLLCPTCLMEQIVQAKIWDAAVAVNVDSVYWPLTLGEKHLWAAAYVAELGRCGRIDQACAYAHETVEQLRQHVASTVPAGRGMAGEMVGT